MNELAIAALLCNLLNGGTTELLHQFSNQGDTTKIRVDCETPTHVIEVGLDGKIGARDSVHQAVFAALLTGKRPMVVIIDRDGSEGRYEQEMRMVTQELDVAYGTCKQSFIQRWAATAWFRDLPLDKNLNDLPREIVSRQMCDLAGEFDLPVLE